MRSQPVVHQINTWVWLADLSQKAGRRVTLADVPDGAWDEALLPGVDTVWLMGVWERSDASRAIARRHPGLQEEYRRALPDVTPEDVVGSPYSVHRYTVDRHLGGDEGLAAARAALRARGAGLLVDYVPNHVAVDHPWVREHPEWFVTGNPGDPDRAPEAFVDVGGTAIALGKDPFFPAWTDVAQLNAFSPGLRDATRETLAGIAERADGVRCDMAMLMLNDVFAGTWGPLAGTRPREEFWPPVIDAVRRQHPEFRFVAEAYWDMEARLLEHGFDACYDKRLYDRLVTGDVRGVADHLGADLGYQQRMVRFLENHDEPRAAATFPAGAWGVMAVVLLTLPGWVLLHEGQADGRRIRPPVQLGRRPAEPADRGLRDFYRRLLGYVHDHRLRAGRWQQAEVSGAGDGTTPGILGWWWEVDGVRHIVVVNLTDVPARGRVRGPWHPPRHGQVVLEDALSSAVFHRDPDELVADRLHVELGAWGSHLLRWEPSIG
jgi:hypothetical protein